MWLSSRHYPASRGLTGAFVPRVVRSVPSPGPGSSPLASWPGPQSCCPGPMGAAAQAVLKVVAGSLPMSIPTLPSRCIILKSWGPDAIPDIISVQHINTATRAWSLTGQEDHEHWQDLRRHSSRMKINPWFFCCGLLRSYSSTGVLAQLLLALLINDDQGTHYTHTHSNTKVALSLRNLG